MQFYKFLIQKLKSLLKSFSTKEVINSSSSVNVFVSITFSIDLNLGDFLNDEFNFYGFINSLPRDECSYLCAWEFVFHKIIGFYKRWFVLYESDL